MAMNEYKVQTVRLDDTWAWGDTGQVFDTVPQLETQPSDLTNSFSSNSWQNQQLATVPQLCLHNTLLWLLQSFSITVLQHQQVMTAEGV